MEPALLYSLMTTLFLIPLCSLLYHFLGEKRRYTTPSRGTYRVRDIPTFYQTRDDCQKAIEAWLSTPNQPCTIRVRSFATNYDHSPDSTITTRTITFDLNDIPSERLKPNPQKQWPLKVFHEGQQIGYDLTIDTHFDGFTVLSSPKYEDHEFDLVAISGLGGHAWGSFKKRKQTSMWLADTLPQKWPRARIMIYGYQSPIMSTQNRQDLVDIAHTFKNDLVEMRKSSRLSRCVPIIILAHSLGGLVVKQALVSLSKESLKMQNTTFQSVYAMLFFGVPCKGLDAERTGLTAMVKGQSTAGFLSDIRLDAPMIDQLAEKFEEVFNGREVKIFSFYETLESPTAVVNYWGRASMNGPAALWIGKDAAFNGRESERKSKETYSIAISANHSDLVKCEDDETFKRIFNVLKGFDWKSAKEAVRSDKMQQQASRDAAILNWNEEESECMRSLGPSTYAQDKDFNRNRIEGTCEWFLRHQNFKDWHERNASGLLWVSGDPGSGKSVLSKYLVDEKLQRTNRQSTCYYFFKDSTERNDASIALRSILHQLFDQQPALLKYALEDFRRSKTGFLLTFDVYWNILLQATKSTEAQDVVCVIDALDECRESDRYNLISKLSSLYKFRDDSSATRSVLKFLVTSRPYVDIERKFEELTERMPTIRLAGEEDPEAISDEINLVIESRVRELKRADVTVKSQIKEALCAQSNRTYLWVVLVFDVLEETLKLTPKNVALLIDNLPETVEKAYNTILNRSHDIKKAKKLLHIVLCAERPLKLVEMDIALNITADCTKLEDIDVQQTDELRKTEIRNLCGLFLTIVDSKVYLIHQTAKDFLLCAENNSLKCTSTLDPSLGQNWKSQFSSKDGNKILTEACVSYLLLSDFEKVSLKYTEKYGRKIVRPSYIWYLKSHYAFLTYSATFWTEHFREAKVQRSESIVTKKAALLCDTNLNSCLRWLNIYITSAKEDTGWLELCSSLSLAAYFGHVTTVEQLLLDENIQVDIQNSAGRTPLFLAAYKGYKAVVKLLLDRGAKVDVKDHYCKTPLSVAAQAENESIIRLLLDRGAKVDAEDSEGRTPLLIAAGVWNNSTVQLLLDRGAKVDAEDREGQTPLLIAAGVWDNSTVQLLLDRGAKVDAKDHYGRTPLLIATQVENESIIQLLLDRGAKVDAKDHYGQTPLLIATQVENEYIIQLLLDRGAKVDAEDSEGRTTLLIATQAKSESIVQLLLERDAKVDAEDSEGRTPLLLAVIAGYKSIVQLLLDRGARIDIEDRQGRTPLLLAIIAGYKSIVQLLLDRGAMVDAEDIHGRTPLSFAVKAWNKPIVQLLLDRGAVVDSKNTHGRTPLSFAAETWDNSTVQLLLDRGAMVDAEDVDGRTPLSFAAKEGHRSILQLLLDKGAMVDAEDIHGRTPLSFAAEAGDESTIQLLLDRGRQADLEHH